MSTFRDYPQIDNNKQIELMNIKNKYNRIIKNKYNRD